VFSQGKCKKLETGIKNFIEREHRHLLLGDMTMTM